MKKLILPILFIFSTLSFSKTVEFDLRISYEKQGHSKITETRIVTKLDKDFEIPFQDENSFKLKMKASQKHDGPRKGDDFVMLGGSVYIMEDNKEKLISSPYILSRFNEESSIEVQDNDGVTFKLSVTPRLKL